MAQAGHVVTRTLNTRSGGRRDASSETLVPFALNQITSPDNRAHPRAGEPAPTLVGDGRSAVAFQCQGSNVGPIGCLRSGNGGTTGGVPFIVNSERSDARQKHAHEASVARSLDSTGGYAAGQGGTVVVNALKAHHSGPSYDSAGCHGVGPVNLISAVHGVRRLTPRECERLQGWPDDWTRWDAEGREVSDSARYRMIGNGVSAPVARWIGERILRAQERLL
jgi:DNA (cytosine-5)-methyltransferase 1